MAVTYWDVGDDKPYTTLTAVRAAILAATPAGGGNLAGMGEQRIRVFAKVTTGNIYMEFVDFSTNFFGETANDFISMYAMVLHYGMLNQGIQIFYSGAAKAFAILPGPYSRIVGFRVKCINLNPFGLSAPIYILNVNNVLIDECIIQDSTQTASSDVKGINIFNSPNVEIRNFIINNLYASSDVVHGVVSQQSNGTVISNGTIWNLSPGPHAYGIYANLNFGTCIIRNVYAGNCGAGTGGQAFKKHMGTFNIDYCTSDDGSAALYGGAHNKTNKAGANQFVSIVSGSEDFRPLIGSDIWRAAESLYGQFQSDVAGKKRPTWGPWTIGAFREQEKNGQIQIWDCLDLIDSMVAQSIEFAKKLGTGVEAASASLGAQNNINRIKANADSDVQLALLKAFKKQMVKVTTHPNAFEGFYTSAKALKNHLGNIGHYLEENLQRAPFQFKTMVELFAIEKIKSESIFSPVISNMGEITIDDVDPPGGGGATSTFVDGNAINIRHYYASNLVLHKTTASSGVGDPFTITVTLTKWDMTSEDKDVAVDGLHIINLEYDIGTHGTDMYIDITDMIIKVGAEPVNANTINQKWKGMSELERSVAL